MRRRRPTLQLTDKQQLIVAVLLVILLAISALYCLGFASLTLRQTLEKTPIPWTASPSGEEMEVMPTLPPVEVTSPPTTWP